MIGQHICKISDLKYQIEELSPKATGKENDGICEEKKTMEIRNINKNIWVIKTKWIFFEI